MPRRRVGLATCSRFPALHPDDQLLLPELSALGIDARPVVWDDPGVDWAGFELVVVRETWDYTGRREQFLRWAASVPRLANPAAVLAWNTDKHYLRELAGAGAPVPATRFFEPGQYPELATEGVVVVKPAIGAGSADAGRYRLADPGERAAALALCARLLAAGRSVLVQPYLHGVDEHGETALVFFAGRLSHAARKGPMLAGPHQPGVDPHEREQLDPRAPTAAEREVAESVLAAAAVPGPLLYARVDLVPGADGAPVVMELELTEPMLFLRFAPTAPAHFAAAIAEWVG